MNLSEIRKAVKNTPNIAAHARSFEGDIYLLEIDIDDQVHYAGQPDTDAAIQFKCLKGARDFAEKAGIDHVDLVYDTPYDEMIGLTS